MPNWMMRGSKVLVIWPPVDAVMPLGAADRAGQVQVGVVEDVVELYGSESVPSLAVAHLQHDCLK